ncbi:MAG: methylated-DNA--[protein]-cysteine S-methyltransferase [Actinocatenispora sp.]
MRWLTVPSPVGELIAVAGDDALRRLRFGGPRPAGRPDPGHEILAATAAQLGEYFAGSRTEFDLPLDLVGSEFERAVWAELPRIPYAETRSYGDIARAVADDVGVSRAVGVANNHNPVPIIVPCHRVVGANRKLVGYGGGLDRKRFLLELEARVQLTDGLLSL